VALSAGERINFLTKLQAGQPFAAPLAAAAATLDHTFSFGDGSSITFRYAADVGGVAHTLNVAFTPASVAIVKDLGKAVVIDTAPGIAFEKTETDIGNNHMTLQVNPSDKNIILYSNDVQTVTFPNDQHPGLYTTKADTRRFFIMKPAATNIATISFYDRNDSMLQRTWTIFGPSVLTILATLVGVGLCAFGVSRFDPGLFHTGVQTSAFLPYLGFSLFDSLDSGPVSGELGTSEFLEEPSVDGFGRSKTRSRTVKASGAAGGTDAKPVKDAASPLLGLSALILLPFLLL